MTSHDKLIMALADPCSCEGATALRAEIERLRVRLKHAESFIHERHRAGYEAAVREEIDHG